MRTEGIPSAVAVASAIGSGWRTPAGAASSNQRSNWTVRVGVEVGEVHGPSYRPCGSATLLAVATTKSIEIRTEIPGPRSREILERGSACGRGATAGVPAVVAAEARNATITDVDGNTFIDFAGGVGVMQRRPRQSACRRGDPGAGGAVRPHRFHGRAVCGVRRARRAAGRARSDLRSHARRLLQLGRRGGRERRQDRPPRDGPAGRDRVRGRASTAGRCSR